MTRRSERFVLTALLAAAVLLASCGRLAAPQDEGAATGRLTIVVEDGRTGLSRSIAPGQPTVADLGDAGQYQLRLTGTASRQDLPERVVTLAGGRATLDNIPDGLWHLTLTAYNAAGITPLLSGHSTVEVRSGQERVEARFTLTPVAGGTSTISLTVNWQEADRFFVQPAAGPYPSGLTVSMELYDPATGQKATSYERRADGSNGAPSDTDAFFRRGFTGGSGGSTAILATTFTYTGGTSGSATYNVPAGMYRLEFTITGGNLPAGARAVWHDLLYVETGRQTTGNVAIPQLICPPASPQGLAGRTTQLTASGSYTATLEWGCVYNAEHYEVQLLRHESATSPASDRDWETLARAGAIVYTYTGAAGADSYTNAAHPARAFAMVTSGGLLGSSTGMSLSMRLSSGFSYGVRIRSVNHWGSSGWTYLPGSLTPTAPVAPSSFAYESYPEYNGEYLTEFTWSKGLFDGGGSHELEIMEFTTSTAFVTNLGYNLSGNAAKTMTFSDATWETVRQAAGSTVHAYTSSTIGGASAPVGHDSGGLGAADESLWVSITRGADKFYCARLRTRNSTGDASPWLYVDSLVMPAPFIHSHSAGPTYVLNGLTVWDVELSIGETGWGEGYELSWIRNTSGQLAGYLDNDSAWRAFQRTDGQGMRNIGKGASYTISQLDNNRVFSFRLRTRSAQGFSAWSYYEYETAQQ